MQLKLAEYDLKTGKFFQFREFKNFALTQGGIILRNISKLIDGSVTRAWPFIWREAEDEGFFMKDKAHPLNRFNGLFNGRTYGNGRFVLLIGFDTEIDDKKFTIWQDSIAHRPACEEKGFDELNYLATFDSFEENCTCCNKVFGFDQQAYDRKCFEPDGEFQIKNLHESPELFEKIK